MSLGKSIKVTPDLGEVFTWVSERDCLRQDLELRFLTPLGSLFYDETYGLDVRKYLGMLTQKSTAFLAAAELSAEALKDPRVERATCEVTLDAPSKTLSARLTIEDAAGPFTLVLTVTPDIVRLSKG